ncbi:MAG: ABC transporter ATP-binding protein [Bradyrhizobiaceae bacterium]|nr:ABC transporter ATP-binding protein [Bradyrhizobiaceae bacterium]
MHIAAHAVSVRFGGLVAVDQVSIQLERGEILGLIGPNGAGKTTLINVLSGFQRPLAGTIVVGERDCTRLPRHGFPRAGVVRTFQAVRLFGGLSVSENVEIGYLGRGLGRAEARRRAADILDELRLADKARLPASGLSYGEQRRVGLARALAINPRFLLLDEPAAGLAAAEAEELRQLILDVRANYRCGVLLTEHNMALVMNLCERIHVLDGGKTIATGTPAEIRADAGVRRAYLGPDKLQ